MRSVVEGIETSQQLDIVTGIGCDEVHMLPRSRRSLKRARSMIDRGHALSASTAGAAGVVPVLVEWTPVLHSDCFMDVTNRAPIGLFPDGARKCS